MIKVRYRFNQGIQAYDKKDHSLNNIFHKIKLVIGISLIFSVIMTAVFVQFYETPRDRKLKLENQRLLTQYELMFDHLEKIDNVLSDLQQRDDNLYRVIFEADPIPSSTRKSGFGGVNKYENLKSLDNSELIIKTAKKLDVITKEAYIQSKSFDEILDLALDKEKLLASLPAIMPISNKDLTRTASGWGNRIHPVYKIRKFHSGMDFTAPIGTEIYATGDGTVTKVESSTDGYGKYVKINHGFGYETLYGHMSGFNVKPGQKVKRGNVIGFVGNTGISTGPHVHYEVHRNGDPVNPQAYYFKDITADEYDRMVAISNNAGQTYD